jgi:hypothetical protein
MYFDEMFLQVNVTTTVLFIGDEASDVVLLIGVNENHKRHKRNTGMLLYMK